MSIMAAHLTTQYYAELAGTGGMEANQDYTVKNYTYGGSLGIEIKNWNPDGCYYNVIDYPFALVRLLDGADTKFRPRGNALPSLRFALEQVVPSKDNPR